MKKIMLLGTASSVGKSTVATAFCRYYKNKGYKVAPFKALNISLNSFVTEEGLEMGRAQAVQAEACEIKPLAAMNPVLLKPSGNNKTQVIINGKVDSTMDAYSYKELNKKLKVIVKDTFYNLAENYDVMILEGSGSCAEINLRDSDIANMSMAEAADADVILVADIDKGGVFASVVGTIMLLTEEERKRVKGIIINKFRGNVDYFKPAMKQLEEIINIPVLGVLPYFDFDIEDEDSVTERIRNKDGKGLDIAIIRLPHMSNFTDFNPLERIDDVNVRYITSVDDLKNPDIIIIPGTKNTISDLRYIKEKKLDKEIIKLKDNGSIIFGICGGYQMLGKTIEDSLGIEDTKTSEQGLGLLDINTIFNNEKRTIQASGWVSYDKLITKSCNKIKVNGYEIHNGVTSIGDDVDTFIISDENEVLGVCNKEGNIFGTYLHGIFEEGEFTNAFINDIKKYKGYIINDNNMINYKEYKLQQYDKLAKLLEENIELKRLDLF